MKCIHCGAEWNTSSQISFCPFCGKSLTAAPEIRQEQSMVDVLRSVRDQFGEEVFRNSKQLMGILSDLLPERQRERRLLGYLFSCGGQTVLMDALKKSPGEQSVAVNRVAKKLYEDWFIRSDAVYEVCAVFWYAMGGAPEALEAMKKSMKKSGTGKEASASGGDDGKKTAAAQTGTPKTDTPKKDAASADTAQRDGTPRDTGRKNTPPKDPGVKNDPASFLITGSKLEKYTGTDPVVRIPDGIVTIGRDAFKQNHLVREVFLPDSVVTLEDNAFSGCWKLEKINFPQGLKNIGRSAFSYCYVLQSADLPRGLAQLGSNAFCQCKALKEVVVPGGIAEIESWTFEMCSGLQRVVLESGVRSLGWRSFRLCTDLKAIAIPDSVTAIQNSSFAGCGGISVLASGAWKTGHPDLLRKIP